MRINLTTPFSERNKVKALGARWDPNRKTWYIVNVEDLTPFKQWIPEIADWNEQEAARKAVNKPQKARKAQGEGNPPGSKQNAPKRASAPRTTGPAVLESCGCSVLPWEHCEHTRH